MFLNASSTGTGQANKIVSRYCKEWWQEVLDCYSLTTPAALIGVDLHVAQGVFAVIFVVKANIASVAGLKLTRLVDGLNVGLGLRHSYNGRGQKADNGGDRELHCACLG